MPRLVDRVPHVEADRLIAELVPPPRFAAESFATYLPDPAQPTQAAAVAGLHAFAAQMNAPTPTTRSWFRRPAPPEGRAGIYLDGGFGVGKTHLLASLWHEAPAPQGVRHVRRVHPPGRRPGLRPHRRGAVRPPAGLHRRVRARRPGRHRPDVHAAQPARRRRASAWRPPPTRCRTGSARAGSPPTTSCARSRACPRTSTSTGSTARTTVTVACPRRRRRCRRTRWWPRPATAGSTPSPS